MCRFVARQRSQGRAKEYLQDQCNVVKHREESVAVFHVRAMLEYGSIEGTWRAEIYVILCSRLEVVCVACCEC